MVQFKAKNLRRVVQQPASQPRITVLRKANRPLHAGPPLGMPQKVGLVLADSAVMDSVEADLVVADSADSGVGAGAKRGHFNYKMPMPPCENMVAFCIPVTTLFFRMQ
jgi:hypothetical protein